MKKQYLSILLILGLFVASCSKDAQTTPDETPIEAGKGRLKINLSGADYASNEDAKGQKSSVQREEINLEDGTTAVVTLENIGKYSPVVKRASNRAASTPVTNALPNGTYYGVTLHNEDGDPVQTAYLQVGGDNEIDIAEGTYTAVLFSRGENEQSGVEALAAQYANNEFTGVLPTAPFMATVVENFEIADGEATTIDAILLHRFAQIEVNVNLPSGVQANSAKVTTENYSLNYNTSTDTVENVWGQEAQNEHVLTANGSTVSGTLILGGFFERRPDQFLLTIETDTETKEIPIPNVRVESGERYNLNINFANSSDVINYENPSWGDGLINEVLPETIIVSENGFELDLTQLDNSFAIEVNGEQIFTAVDAANDNFTYHDIQFQGMENNDMPTDNNDNAYAPNIEFTDGDIWGVGSVPSIYEMNSTQGKPIVRLKVDGDGNVTLFAAKEENGALFPVRAVTNKTGTNGTRREADSQRSYDITSQFNPVTWNKGGADNTVKITMMAYAQSSRLNGTLRKID